MRPRRLYTRIYLHFISVLLIAALVVSGAFTLLWRHHGPRGPAERLARRLAARFADSVSDRAAGEALARRLAEEYAIDITLRDPQGRRLFSIGPEQPPLGRADLEAVYDPARAVATLRSGRVLSSAVPVFARRTGEGLGVLQVSFAPRLPNLLRPAAAVALVLLFIAVATAPLARRISRPVELLTEANRHLGAGELGYRIAGAARPCAGAGHGPRGQRRRPDQLAELLNSWNDMAERIEVLVKGQRELLANVSHELRSPLARIRLALELLPKDTGTEARLLDVERDLDELERLIDDVLTTSRLESSGLPMRVEPVEVRELLTLLVERTRHAPLFQGQEVRLADGPPVRLMADGALLKRALWNLLENAAKYGAPPIVLAAEPGVPGTGAATLSVTDCGPGIPEAERERVFEPFYRADKARTPSFSDGGDGGAEGRGFGLGLTFAERVARVHGGSIRVGPARVDGGKEAGCRFVLTLPGDVL